MALAHGLVASIALGLEANRESRRLDPLYLYAPLNVAGNLFYLGRSEEALRYNSEILEREPDLPWAHMQRVFILTDFGRLREAEAMLSRVKEAVAQKRHSDFFLPLAELVLALEKNDRAAADRSLDQIFAMMSDTAMPSHDLEWIYLFVMPPLSRHGKLDPAFRVAKRVIEGGAIPPYDWLLLNPHLKAFRADPRFQEIAAPSRAQFEAMLSLLEEARDRRELPEYLDRPLAQLVARLGVTAPKRPARAA
jgi:tetratricopeptide (TPR) repeat protein